MRIAAPRGGGGAAPDDARSTPVGFGAPDWPPPSGDGRACSASTDLRRARHAPPGGSGPPTVSARKGAEGWTRAVVRHPTAPPPSGGGRVRGRYPGKTTSGNPDGNLPQFSQGRRYLWELASAPPGDHVGPPVPAVNPVLSVVRPPFPQLVVPDSLALGEEFGGGELGKLLRCRAAAA